MNRTLLTSAYAPQAKGQIAQREARVEGDRTQPVRSESAALQARAELVRALMTTHPDEVRSVALPPSVSARLLESDPGNAGYLERDTAVAGSLGIVVADDFQNGSADRVYVLHTRAGHVAVHTSISVSLGRLLHTPVTLAGVQLGGDFLAESVTPSPGLAAALDNANAAAPLPAPNQSLTCSTTGQQRTAVLLLQNPGNSPAFPGAYGSAAWWQAAIAGSSNSVNALWAEEMPGTYASVDVYGPISLPQRYSCSDYLALRSAALTAAGNTVDLSKYTRIVLGFPESSCIFGGLADIGCNAADSVVPHPYSVVWMPIVSTYTANTGVWASLAHELGHNLGLNHANTLDFGNISLGPIDFQATNPGTVGNFGSGSTTAAGAVTAIDTEYGDRSSVMGNPWSIGPGPYSAEHRAKLLGWIPQSGLETVTAAGTYTLQGSSGSTGIRALRVLRDPVSASWLWLEYRNGGTLIDSANLASIPGENATSGAVVHYENGYGVHEKTYQLDMSPVSKGNNFAAAALVPGTTWSDPYSPLSLHVTGPTVAGLSVSVSYDQTCAAFHAATSPIPAAGGSATIQVTAPAGCAWQASSNASWMSLSGTTAGKGNGAFTWSAAANSGTGQRITYLAVGRQSQRLLQLGAGSNVVALSPASATVTPGTSNVLSLAIQNAPGFTGLQTVSLDALAAGAPPCSVFVRFSNGKPFFFLLDPVSEQYTDSLAPGSSAVISTKGCALSGARSNAVASGSTVTLNLDLTFPTDSPGMRALYASANAGTELPLGLLNVATPAASQLSNVVTTTTLQVAPTQALPGTAVTLSATVAANAGSAAPNGSVTFLDGSVSLGTAALNSSGVATLSTAALAAGVHTLTAAYGGNSNFMASTSPAVNVTVAQLATTTTLSSASTTIGAGSTASLSITVAATAAPGQIAAGSITIFDGAAAVGTATLRNGSATYALSGMQAGTHSLTAVYGGSSVALGSTSNVLIFNVSKASVSFLLSAAAGTVLTGASTPLTITATNPNQSVMPSGTITVQDAGLAIATVPLVNGAANVSTGALATGSHTLTASYAGDDTYAAVQTTPVTVNAVDFALTGSSPSIAITAGATTGNTATLLLTPGGNGFPFAVALTCSGAPAGAACSVSPSTATPGSDPIPITVAVTPTAAPNAAIARPKRGWAGSSHTAITLRGSIAVALGLPFAAWIVPLYRRRALPRLLALCLATLAVAAGAGGCGGGAGNSSSTPVGGGTAVPGAPAVNATLTVQATASSNGSSLTRTLSFPLLIK